MKRHRGSGYNGSGDDDRIQGRRAPRVVKAAPIAAGPAIHSAKKNRRTWSRFTEVPCIPETGQSARQGRLHVYAQLTAVAMLTTVVFANSLNGDFVYDDRRALLENDDINVTYLPNIFFNDYWGTPMTHPGSHGSYRPLTILTFRWNYLANGFTPFYFHLVNVGLHCCVSLLVYALCYRQTGSKYNSTVTSALFSCHPVHCEAVSGIVGRADILAALFFLLAIGCYDKSYNVLGACDSHHKSSKDCKWIFLTCSFAFISMLCKETGITSLSVCCVMLILSPRICGKTKMKRIGFLVLVTLFFLYIRIRVIGAGHIPTFSAADNPIPHLDSLLSRVLTLLYLPILNLGLLLWPRYLCFDYSLDIIGAVHSLADPRVFVIAAFYLLFFVAVFVFLRDYLVEVVLYRHLVFSLSILIIPFIPASNFFAYVGFVMAERVLYIPSIGMCMVLGKIAQVMYARKNTKMLTNAVVFLVVTLMSLKTAQRNLDWNSEMSLYKSGVQCSPAKAYANLGNVLTSQVEKLMATSSLSPSSLPPPSPDPASHSNGAGEHPVQAQPASSSSHRRHHPHSTPGEGGAMGRQGARVKRVSAAQGDFEHDGGEEEEEEDIVEAGQIHEDTKHDELVANRISSVARQAEEAYKAALKHRSNMADVHYNMGILLQKTGRKLEAIASYRNAVVFRPSFSLAFLNAALLLAEIGRKTEAEKLYLACIRIQDGSTKDPRRFQRTKTSAYYNLGCLYIELNRFQEAKTIFLEAIKTKPPDFHPRSLYNMIGEVYFSLGDLQEAEKYFKLSYNSDPKHIPALITLAKLADKNNRFQVAEDLFAKAFSLALHRAENSSLHQHYAVHLLNGNRFMQAANHYVLALQSHVKVGGLYIDKECFHLAFHAANSYKLANRPRLAEKYYRQAITCDPSQPESFLNLGAVLHTSGKLESALHYYEMALQLHPNDIITTQNIAKLQNLQRKIKKSNF